MSDSGGSVDPIDSLRPRDLLLPVKLDQPVDDDAFVEFLNQREFPDNPWKIPLGYNPPKKLTEYEVWVEGKTEALDPWREVVPGVNPQRAMRDLLKRWVDEWLDSSKADDGVETPLKRDLSKTKRARQAVLTYSLRGNIRLEPGTDGLSLRLNILKAGPNAPLPAPQWRWDQLARQSLVLFLLSELRHKLGKCRTNGCGHYFQLSHWNRTYKRGIYCDACKRSRSLKSAAISTSVARHEAESMLYRLAAKRFAKLFHGNSDWYRVPRVKRDVTSYLNTQIQRSDLLRSVYSTGARKGVTGKWLALSKNRRGIEKALEEDRNAKG
jgi:hypothetical protein